MAISRSTASTIGSIAGSYFGGPIGGQIGGALGGLFGKKKKGISTAEIAKRQAHIQGELQKDQWDVNMSMAKKYGIHPLAALGIQPNAAPVSQYNTGDISGQNLSRAAAASVPNERSKQLLDLQIERAGLENDLLRTQISNVNSQPGDSPNPVPGQVQGEPHRQISARKDDSGLAAGKPPGIVEYDLGNGQTIELPFSEEGPSEAIENLPIYKKYYKQLEMDIKRLTAKGLGPIAAAKAYSKKHEVKVKASQKEFEAFIRKLQKKFKRKGKK